MTKAVFDRGRRRFVKAAGASALATLLARHLPALAERATINDVTGLNPVEVADVLRPRSVDAVREALRVWQGAVSVGGGRYSMGGQTALPDSLHLDMRSMNGNVFLDVERKVIRVQAGMTWRDMQDLIDPHDLAVKIMQSYSNFTVGGSVAVNCHGRYVGRGALVNSIRALQVVTASGEVLELDRSRNGELFRAVVGGYGGLGVVTEVELDLEDNSRIERSTEHVRLEEYPEFFRERVLSDRRAVLHNADLVPPDFVRPMAVTWRTSAKPLTERHRLVPRDQNYRLERNVIWAISELPGGSSLGRGVVDRLFLEKPAVVWRNREASLDTASLEPQSRRLSTFVLQEYFVPVSNFVSFARAMAEILKRYRVNALNISIRHAPADTTSLLAWAQEEVFALVLYYKQSTSPRASATVQTWTRELIDAALKQGGRYYLPYRLHATREQFRRAYPRAEEYVALKAQIDPRNRFGNLFLDAYLRDCCRSPSGV